MRSSGIIGACLAAAAVLTGCGPTGTASFELSSGSEALAAGSEALDLASASSRARAFAQVEAQARAQSAAPAPDSPAVFAVEVGASLLPAPLPAAAALRAGAAAQVDLDASEDPWPDERRASLLGASERDAARAAGSALAEALSLGDRAVVVERAAGAPYAAAWVQGRLRLNPALLYLAAAAAAAPAPEPAASGASCATAPGLPSLGLILLAHACAIRRRR